MGFPTRKMVQDMDKTYREIAEKCEERGEPVPDFIKNSTQMGDDRPGGSPDMKKGE